MRCYIPMYLLFAALAFSIATLSSCNREPERFTKPFTVDTAWSTLYIGAENDQQIVIDNTGDDFSRVFIYHHGSFFAPVPKNQWRTDTLIARFTKAEKDTLVYLAKDLIINHITAASFCNDYVGSLRLTVRYKHLRWMVNIHLFVIGLLCLIKL